jgi:mannose-6-phosphate isomerase-like protein (cupin superfamily)
MAVSHPSYRMTLAEAAAQLPAQTVEQLRFVTLFKRGSLSVELYAPQGRDYQQPHAQDELYIVMSGSGVFVNDGERSPFGPGDVLFVPAGVEHRFENFTREFQTWVIFYGPHGAE